MQHLGEGASSTATRPSQMGRLHCGEASTSAISRTRAEVDTVQVRSDLEACPSGPVGSACLRQHKLSANSRRPRTWQVPHAALGCCVFGTTQQKSRAPTEWVLVPSKCRLRTAEPAGWHFLKRNRDHHKRRPCSLHAALLLRQLKVDAFRGWQSA